MWTGHITMYGYGNLSINYQRVFAHRFSYELHFGPIPEGMEVCHSCDTPPCVSPSHLFLGTHAENMLDMVSKGRNNPSTGLTDDDRREMARLYYVENEQIWQIARLFHVSAQTTFKAVRAFSSTVPENNRARALPP